MNAVQLECIARDGGMQLCCAIVHVGTEDKDGTSYVQWFSPLISFGLCAQRSGVPEVHDIFIDCFLGLRSSRIDFDAC